FFFFSSRRRHTRFSRDWSSDVCSSDLAARRRRKLLLHRHELDRLMAKAGQAGHTIVPLSLYFKDGRVKVEIALAKGKQLHDKRQTLREKQDAREVQKAMSAHLRQHG